MVADSARQASNGVPASDIGDSSGMAAASGPLESPITAGDGATADAVVRMTDRELAEATYLATAQLLQIFQQLYATVQAFQDSPMLKMFGKLGG